MDTLVQLKALTGSCTDAPIWPLPGDELIRCLDSLHELEQVLAVVKLRVIREIEGRDLPAAQHASSTAVWLREHLQISIHAAKRLTELARYLDHHPVLETAVARGEVNVEQAQVIAATITDLPAHLGPYLTGEAEAAMIVHASKCEPVALRRVGTRILDHVAPELADAADAAALDRQDKRARDTRSLHLSRNGDGRVRLTGWLDEEAAAIVNAALDPLCAPGHDPGGESRTPAQRRADALVEVCELAMRTDHLPTSGGERPHLVVTLPFDVLRQQLGVATLDSGERLSPKQARRLACDAALIPAVLGGDGQVLDLGRTRRLITGSLRRALEARDRGCAFPGCDRPAKWCHGHHIISWIDGGRTSLDNAVLLCGHHHRIIHKGHWQVRMATDGLPEFIPPSYVDAERKPRRNTYHRRA
jgi:hypothetical protein